MHLWPRILIFLAITCSILIVIHYYLWARLARDTGLNLQWEKRAAVILFVLMILMPITMVLGRLTPRGPFMPVAWFSYTWMGLLFLLLVTLAIGDIGKCFLLGLPSLLKQEPVDPERRRFLATLIGSTAVLSSLGLTVSGLWGATAQAVRIKRVKVKLDKLPRTVGPYRIAQITDLHVGPTIGRGFMAEIVSKVNVLNPDLIAITGDLMDGTLENLRDSAEPIKDLRAPDGVYFVTGNHEYFSGDVDEWIAWMESFGIKVLRNERVSIRNSFDLAGVDDWSARGNGHRYDPQKALAGRDPNRPVVLMAHQPRGFDQAVNLGVDLQISGHTHGGQIVPFNYVVELFEPYVAGLYKNGHSQIYVSCGTGYWGPPMRIGVPSEITEIELTAAS